MALSYLAKAALLAAFACSMGNEARACLPDFTALEVLQVIDPANGSSFSHKLKSKNLGEINLTKAALIGTVVNGRLDLKVTFEDEHGMGLPYNVYNVLVAEGDRALFWRDFTQFCRGPGQAVFPGTRIDLGTIKDLDKGPRELRIIVWGKRI